MSDHYSILEIERSSTPEQIKTAYRKLARKHHPDKGGDPAAFRYLTDYRRRIDAGA